VSQLCAKLFRCALALLSRADSTHPAIASLDHSLFACRRKEGKRKIFNAIIHKSNLLLYSMLLIAHYFTTTNTKNISREAAYLSKRSDNEINY